MRAAASAARVAAPLSRAPSPELLGLRSFLHSEETTTGEYFKFHTNDSAATLAISDLHWLFVNGAHASPATVKLGDLLETPAGAMTSVDKHWRDFYTGANGYSRGQVLLGGTVRASASSAKWKTLFRSSTEALRSLRGCLG